MKKKITEFEGATFPQTIEVNQWMSKYDLGRTYFVTHLSVVSKDECQVAYTKFIDDDDEKETEKSGTIILYGEEFYLADSPEEIVLDIKKDKAIRNVEEEQEIKKVVSAFRTINEIYANSSYEQDKRIKDAMSKKGFEDTIYNCKALLPEEENSFNKLYHTAVGMLIHHSIRFKDSCNSNIFTTVPLSAITSVCTNMTWDDEDAVEVNVGKEHYYITKKADPALYKILMEIYC